MYSLFYHSNIRLHISIINNFFFSVRGCDTTFSQFRISLTSYFFFLEFTHCYMLSASLALSHWKLLLKKVHNDVSIYITHSVLYCVQKKVEKKKNLSSYLVFINISSVQYETCFFMDCILYFIHILWYQSVSFNPREMLHKKQLLNVLLLWYYLTKSILSSSMATY